MKSASYFFNLGSLIGKFSLVGILTTGVYTLLASILILSKQFSPVISSSIAFLVTMPISYWGHRSFTFKVKKKNLEQIKKYLIYNIFGFMMSNILIFVSSKLDGIGPLIGVLLVAIMLPILNFFFLKIFVFSD